MDLFTYLKGGQKSSKEKKPKKPKRQKKVRFGEKQGKYVKISETNPRKFEKKSEDTLDKLLAILVSNLGRNPEDDLRKRRIESDFKIAQMLQKDEDKILSSKKIEDEGPAEAKFRTLQKYKKYGDRFQDIELGLGNLITELAGIDGRTISQDAVNHVRESLDNFSQERDSLKKELLTDMRDNPQDLWEWKGFMENSEAQLINIIDIEQDANKMLQDKLNDRIFEREEEITKAKQRVSESEQRTAQIEQEMEDNRQEALERFALQEAEAQKKFSIQEGENEALRQELEEEKIEAEETQRTLVRKIQEANKAKEDQEEIVKDVQQNLSALSDERAAINNYKDRLEAALQHHRGQIVDLQERFTLQGRELIENERVKEILQEELSATTGGAKKVRLASMQPKDILTEYASGGADLPAGVQPITGKDTAFKRAMRQTATEFPVDVKSMEERQMFLADRIAELELAQPEQPRNIFPPLAPPPQMEDVGEIQANRFAGAMPQGFDPDLAAGFDPERERE